MKLRKVLFIWLAVCALTASLWGQQVTATITGRITDPTGRRGLGRQGYRHVGGARHTICATTNADGYYNLPNLLVGDYNVKVENPGFQTATQSNITLQMNQVAKLDFQLQVGNVQTTVEVTSAAPVLQTEPTLLGQVIDSRTNTTLPLATRNYVQLTLLAAGSVHPDPSSFDKRADHLEQRTPLRERQPRAGQQLHPGRHGQQPGVR